MEKTAVSHNCCHMITLLCKTYLTKSSLQVHTAKCCAAIQSQRTSLTVGMGWCSLIISWLAHLMSMQIVTSPSGLGATTSGETQLVGPSGTSSMIPQASNSSNFFSTFSLTPNGMDGLCNWFYRGIDIKFQLVALQEIHPIKQFLVFVLYVLVCGLYPNIVHWMYGTNV